MKINTLVQAKRRLPEIPRAMVFLTAEKVTSREDPVPLLLLKFVHRYGSLPRHLTLFSVVPELSTPYWPGQRFDVSQFGDNVTSVRMHVGYMETPNMRAALRYLKERRDIRIHATRWTIVMGREELIIDPGSGIRRVPHLVFSFLATWASQANEWFGIGTDTGLSKEVIPILVDRRGRMSVNVGPTALEDLLPAPRRTSHPPEAAAVAPARAEEELPLIEDTSIREIPPMVAQTLPEESGS
jgi:KUP system potassium uptake protein